jgi:hypothetical protein
LNTLDNRLERFTLNFTPRSLPETFSLLTLPEPLMSPGAATRPDDKWNNITYFQCR